VASRQGAPQARRPAAAEYGIEDGRLVREVAGRRQEPGCTVESGTGVVHAWSRTPAGNVFVAAEHGLFVIGPECDVLDPVPLWGGSPEGVPVGVVADGEHRLWLATRSAFGAVDGIQFFGRSFGHADGLPPPPYRGLQADPSGELLLSTDHGSFRYRPGEGPDPELHVLGVDGQTFEPGKRFAMQDGDVELETTARASGGASLRWRDSRNAFWQPLDGEPLTIRGLDPGAHEIVVVAFDRDLRVSPPATILLDVPYPRAFQIRRLIPLAAMLAMLVFAAFAGHAAWTRADRTRWLRSLASAGLVLVLAAQLAAALIPHARGWPFVGFGMYTESVGGFPLSSRQVLYGVKAGGERFPIEIHGAGLGLFELARRLVPAIRGGDEDRQALLDELNQRYYDGRLPAFEIRIERYRLTPRGPMRVAPIHLCRHPDEVPHEGG
jgi:hypothetical protein